MATRDYLISLTDGGRLTATLRGFSVEPSGALYIEGCDGDWAYYGPSAWARIAPSRETEDGAAS